MVILITGGAGFIGSALARRLQAEGNEVRILDNLRHGEAHERVSGVDFIEADVRNRAAVIDSAKGCDRIVHLASVAGVKSVEGSPVDTMAVGFHGANNVFIAAMENEVPGVLCFSSSEVYGTHVSAISEDEPTLVPAPNDPRWGYAAVKLAGEHLARAYSHAKGLSVATFRIFNTYGPGQLGDGAVHNFVRALARGEPIYIRGDGTSVRTWCYIDDTVEATLAALERLPELGGEIFNIGNPHTVCTTLGLAKTVRRLSALASSDIRYVAGGSDVRIRIPNIDKARRVLNWSPSVGLEEGIRSTIDYYFSRAL